MNYSIKQSPPSWSSDLESMPTHTDDSFVPPLAMVLDHLISLSVGESYSVTHFHAVSPPPITILDYLIHLRTFFRCSPECFVMCLVYIDRVVKAHPTFIVNIMSIHRVVLVALILSVKVIDDQRYHLQYYSRIGGVATSELNLLEHKFLELIQWRLHVTADEYNRYKTEVTNAVAQVLKANNNNNNSSISVAPTSAGDSSQNNTTSAACSTSAVSPISTSSVSNSAVPHPDIDSLISPIQHDVPSKSSSPSFLDDRVGNNDSTTNVFSPNANLIRETTFPPVSHPVRPPSLLAVSSSFHHAANNDPLSPSLQPVSTGYSPMKIPCAQSPAVSSSSCTVAGYSSADVPLLIQNRLRQMKQCITSQQQQKVSSQLVVNPMTPGGSAAAISSSFSSSAPANSLHATMRTFAPPPPLKFTPRPPMHAVSSHLYHQGISPSLSSSSSSLSRGSLSGNPSSMMRMTPSGTPISSTFQHHHHHLHQHHHHGSFISANNFSINNNNNINNYHLINGVSNFAHCDQVLNSSVISSESDSNRLNSLMSLATAANNNNSSNINRPCSLAPSSVMHVSTFNNSLKQSNNNSSTTKMSQISGTTFTSSSSLKQTTKHFLSSTSSSSSLRKNQIAATPSSTKLPFAQVGDFNDARSLQRFVRESLMRSTWKNDQDIDEDIASESLEADDDAIDINDAEEDIYGGNASHGIESCEMDQDMHESSYASSSSSSSSLSSPKDVDIVVESREGENDESNILGMQNNKHNNVVNFSIDDCIVVDAVDSINTQSCTEKTPVNSTQRKCPLTALNSNNIISNTTTVTSFNSTPHSASTTSSTNQNISTVVAKQLDNDINDETRNSNNNVAQNEPLFAQVLFSALLSTIPDFTPSNKGNSVDSNISNNSMAPSAIRFNSTPCSPSHSMMIKQMNDNNHFNPSVISSSCPSIIPSLSLHTTTTTHNNNISINKNSLSTVGYKPFGSRNQKLFAQQRARNKADLLATVPSASSKASSSVITPKTSLLQSRSASAERGRLNKTAVSTTSFLTNRIVPPSTTVSSSSARCVGVNHGSLNLNTGNANSGVISSSILFDETTKGEVAIVKRRGSSSSSDRAHFHHFQRKSPSTRRFFGGSKLDPRGIPNMLMFVSNPGEYHHTDDILMSDDTESRKVSGVGLVSGVGGDVLNHSVTHMKGGRNKKKAHLNSTHSIKKKLASISRIQRLLDNESKNIELMQTQQKPSFLTSGDINFAQQQQPDPCNRNDFLSSFQSTPQQTTESQNARQFVDTLPLFSFPSNDINSHNNNNNSINSNLFSNINHFSSRSISSGHYTGFNDPSISNTSPQNLFSNIRQSQQQHDNKQHSDQRKVDQQYQQPNNKWKQPLSGLLRMISE